MGLHRFAHLTRDTRLLRFPCQRRKKQSAEDRKELNAGCRGFHCNHKTMVRELSAWNGPGHSSTTRVDRTGAAPTPQSLLRTFDAGPKD